MSGGGTKPPPDPDPLPTPIAGREEQEAKKVVKQRMGGRQSTILAGKMMSQRGGILNTTKENLGD